MQLSVDVVPLREVNTTSAALVEKLLKAFHKTRANTTSAALLKVVLKVFLAIRSSRT